MRILLGIGHPADVHFFENFIAGMKNRGHEVFVGAREKEITCYLLGKYNIPYHRVSVHRRRAILKIIDYFKRWVRTYRLCKRIRPDMALGVGDFYLPQIGAVLGFRTILITDTESVIHDAFLSFPFADFILTPSCYKKNVKKQIRYDSYNELAYLGRKRFTPDPEIYDLLGLRKDERFVIVRFTGRTAVHDMGCRGITLETKRRAVREFARHAGVFISSEERLPGQLESYRIPCPPEHIHHALYYADLLFGDSATMASEAACLGTPAVYIDDRGRGYTDEQERKYGLVFNFGASLEDQERAVRKGVEILTDAGSKERWRAGRERMLGDKIDLTDFLVEFVEKRKTEGRGER